MLVNGDPVSTVLMWIQAQNCGDNASFCNAHPTMIIDGDFD